MRRKTMVARLRKLGLALVACLVFAVLAPMFFSEQRSDESITISSVLASPRDLHMLTVPVRLSNAPDLTLERSVVYEYSPSATSGPVSRILLDGPVFTLNAASSQPPSGAREGEPENPNLGLLSPLIRQIAALGFELIAIRGGRLDVQMADGTIETLSDIQAEVSQPGKGQIASKGSFTVRGQRLAFNATLGRPADKNAPARWALEASFEGPLIRGSFEGHADMAPDLQLVGAAEISTPSLRRIGSWFGLELEAAEGFDEATVKAELTWARRSLSFEKAHIALDGNEADGRVVLNLGGERPLVDATLDFSQLDLAPYLKGARVQSWSSLQLSLPIVRSLDADLRVSARQVKLMGYTFGQGAATIAVHGGKLQADLTELVLDTGTLSAQLTAAMNEPLPRYALRAKVEKLELGPASRLLVGTTALAGRATLTADLAGTGSSLPEVLRGLSGRMALALPEGGRLALDVDALREAAGAGKRGWAGLAKTQINIGPMEASAVILGGVARAETKPMRSGTLGLAASGRIGLDDGSMDVSLSLKPKVPTDRPLAPADMAGGETVTLRGPLDDPVVSRAGPGTAPP